MPATRTMPKDGAVAVSDGAFWWVFYPDAQGRLTGVMAAKLNACLNLKGGRALVCMNAFVNSCST